MPNSNYFWWYNTFDIYFDFIWLRNRRFYLKINYGQEEVIIVEKLENVGNK